MNILTLGLIERILVIQLGFIAYLLFSIFGHRLALKIAVTFRLNIRKGFSQVILKALRNEGKLSIQEVKRLKKFKKILILTLEELLRKDPELSLKPLEKTLFFPVLKAFCEKRVNAFLWENRNWAARAYQLFPDTIDEKTILKLLDDSSFLNQKIGAELVIYHNLKKGIEKILRKLESLHLYGKYYYLNLFKQADKKVIETVKSIIFDTKEMSLLMGSLWILTIRKDANDFPQLNRFFESRKIPYQLAAIDYVKTHPNKEFLNDLLALKHSSEIQVIKGIIEAFTHYSNQEVDDQLYEWLSHPSKEVVTQSALALYKKGLLKPKDSQAIPVLKDLIPYFEKFYA